MLEIDFSNLSKVSNAHSVGAKEWQRTEALLPKYLENFLGREQLFHKIIDDRIALAGVKKFTAANRSKYRDVVVLGIGGSALGASCLQQALTHLFSNELVSPKKPRLHILDNIDPILLQEISDVIDVKKTLFIVISKSGTTPETVSQFLYFKKLCVTKKLPVKNHFVVVTDAETGWLREVAHAEGITMFVHPAVGGRFSVLSVVGLLPAAFLGINLDRLLAGARSMRDQFVSKKFTDNLPFQLAAAQYLAAQKGKTIHVLMPYAQKLDRFASWYRQLLAESIGKARNRTDETVHVGLTPINALGATDQHSQSQLYNEGPNDKLVMFIAVNHLAKRLSIPALYPGEKGFAFLRGVSFNQLVDVERRGTAHSYTQNDRPNLTITIDRIDEYHLGQLFMLYEGATAFLGEFFGVNAFDQPGVELAKRVTKELLSK